MGILSEMNVEEVVHLRKRKEWKLMSFPWQRSSPRTALLVIRVCQRYAVYVGCNVPKRAKGAHMDAPPFPGCHVG